MLKSLVATLVLFITYSVSASTSIIECTFPALSEKGKLFIALDNLSTPSDIALNYSTFTDFEGEEVAFSYSGEELEWLWMLSLSYDGQSVRLDDRGNLSFFLDSDGCDVGEIYLYANSGFKSGYLSIKHSCSGPERKSTYSKANCRL